jgi:hypothetical protein
MFAPALTAFGAPTYVLLITGKPGISVFVTVGLEVAVGTNVFVDVDDGPSVAVFVFTGVFVRVAEFTGVAVDVLVSGEPVTVAVLVLVGNAFRFELVPASTQSPLLAPTRTKPAPVSFAPIAIAHWNPVAPLPSGNDTTGTVMLVEPAGFVGTIPSVNHSKTP